MKNSKSDIIRNFSILALVSAVLLVFSACPDNDGNDNGNGGDTFTVTFNANGGTPVPEKQSIASGGKVTEPARTSIAITGGGTLEGWYSDEGFSTKWDFANNTVTKNITLYAKWILTVKFDANGGTPVPADQSRTRGHTVIEPTDDVTKTGHTFMGWFKEKALTNKWNFDDPLTSSITLYAKWGFTVTFNSNGGTAVDPVTVTAVTDGTKITKPTDPKKGYPFEGWHKEAALTNAWNFTSDSLTSNITLHAKWGDYDSASAYKLGDPGPGGGKIFHVDEDGFTLYENATDTTGKKAHYLEAAPNDMEGPLAWASTAKAGTSITGTEEEIGAGKKNTALILAATADPAAPAAKECKDYSNSKMSDWFLPSKDELSELFESKTSAGVLVVSNLAADSIYWSSSQSEDDKAVSQKPGTASESKAKTTLNKVRAIRAF